MHVLANTDTRERLLQAGLQIFAANGFEQGTIRAITHHASANQAAVNYHFGNKAGLYEAVVHRAFEQALLPLDTVTEQRRGKAALIRALVSDIVSGALRGHAAATHLRIVSAEILRPTGMLQSLVGDTLGMRTPQLARRIQALSDRNDDAAGALLLAHWLLGSCLVALQLAPKSAYGEEPEALRQQGQLVDKLSGLLLNGLSGLDAA